MVLAQYFRGARQGGIFWLVGEQGYTRDACRSPAAVFTECAQFRAHLTARPRKRNEF